MEIAEDFLHIVFLDDVVHVKWPLPSDFLRGIVAGAEVKAIMED